MSPKLSTFLYVALPVLFMFWLSGCTDRPTNHGAAALPFEYITGGGDMGKVYRFTDRGIICYFKAMGISCVPAAAVPYIMKPGRGAR